jgi:maltodextrin utilization protein YvdJ
MRCVPFEMEASLRHDVLYLRNAQSSTRGLTLSGFSWFQISLLFCLPFVFLVLVLEVSPSFSNLRLFPLSGLFTSIQS